MPWLFGHKKNTEEGLERTRQAWFGRIPRLLRVGRISDEVWDELEEALISADVGVGMTEAILKSVRNKIGKEDAQGDTQRLLQLVKEELVDALGEIDDRLIALLERSSGVPKPLVVLIVGVNGSGKTTSIAKLTRYFQSNGGRVILGAGDTFRAAAIEQLQIWAKTLNVEVVANQIGSDPAAIAYDSVEAGKARHVDVVIVDTAGRLHNKQNLMDELSKIRRVISRLDDEAPHLTLLVLDATTGQNGLAQAKGFTQAVKCDGVILAKLDGTAKGGVVFAIHKELGLPVLFIGTGENVEDLSPFNPRQYVEALLATPEVETAA